MKYKRDIKKIAKEKNRLEKIMEKIGTSPWSPKHVSLSSKAAAEHLQIAIEELNEAEMTLRKYDWSV